MLCLSCRLRPFLLLTEAKMRKATPQFRFRLIAALFLVLLWAACLDQASGPAAPDVLDGPTAAVTQLEIARALPSALRLQSQFTNELLAMPGVVGSAVALGDDGLPTVVALVEHGGVRVPPGMRVIVTGKFSALDWQAVPQGEPQGQPCGKGKQPDCPPVEDPPEGDPPPEEPPEPSPDERFLRPVPIGVSTGHPAITAGTIGARVTDGPNVFALSNNHVYADANAASIGHAVIQPGSYDLGSSPADDIGTLDDFEPIDFNGSCENVMDAAIALSSTADLGNATPGAGYGTPKSSTVAAALNMKVKKFGRTTGQTKGTVFAFNATVNVSYGPGQVACFTKQIIISPGTFSAGGDSGSLVVGDGKGRARSDDGKAVGLLFAGSASYTIISPIDKILTRFGVTIDGS